MYLLKGKKFKRGETCYITGKNGKTKPQYSYRNSRICRLLGGKIVSPEAVDTAFKSLNGEGINPAFPPRIWPWHGSWRCVFWGIAFKKPQMP
jgi:hypothetical protein